MKLVEAQIFKSSNTPRLSEHHRTGSGNLGSRDRHTRKHADLRERHPIISFSLQSLYLEKIVLQYVSCTASQSQSRVTGVLLPSEAMYTANMHSGAGKLSE